MQRQQQQRPGVHKWPHGPGANTLGLLMSQHVDIIAIYRRHRDIIARFRVRRLRAAVPVLSRISCGVQIRR